MSKKLTDNEIKHIGDFMSMVLSYCKTNEEYYNKIAYCDKYKDDTKTRIVDMSTCWRDLSQYLLIVQNSVLDMLISQQPDFVEQNVGFPTKVGQQVEQQLTENETTNS